MCICLSGDLQVGKLMLRGFGEHEESGRYTVLYDGQGHIDFSLVGHTVHYDGQGEKQNNDGHAKKKSKSTVILVYKNKFIIFITTKDKDTSNLACWSHCAL